MIGPEQLDVIRRVCLISELAIAMDELIHGDPVARVMVVGKAVVAAAQGNAQVAAIVEASGLMRSLQVEAQSRMKAVPAVVTEPSRIPREALYPGPKQ
jgi:hypothetical protein